MVVIIGGTELAPVKNVLNVFWNQEDFVKGTRLINGFKDEGGIIFRGDLERWKGKSTTIYTLDTDHKDGQETGPVTEFVPGILLKDFGGDYSVVVVGPPPMMKFTGPEVLNQGVPEEKIWTSFERRMLCAMGKYGRCRIDRIYVCPDESMSDYTQVEYPVD